MNAQFDSSKQKDKSNCGTNRTYPNHNSKNLWLAPFYILLVFVILLNLGLAAFPAQVAQAAAISDSKLLSSNSVTVPTDAGSLSASANETLSNLKNASAGLATSASASPVADLEALVAAANAPLQPQQETNFGLSVAASASASVAEFERLETLAQNSVSTSASASLNPTTQGQGNSANVSASLEANISVANNNNNNNNNNSLTSALPAATASPAVTQAIKNSYYNYGKLPLSFEPYLAFRNEPRPGQTTTTTPPPVYSYRAQGDGYNLFLTAQGEAVFDLRKPVAGGKTRCAEAGVGGKSGISTVLSGTKPTRELCETGPSKGKSGLSNEGLVVRMGLVGAGKNVSPAIQPLAPSSAKFNYFFGSNSADWRSDVVQHQKVSYSGVYSGIDLVYYGSQGGQLEYDFVVAPGGTPGSIRLRFEGADRLEIVAPGSPLLSPSGSGSKDRIEVGDLLLYSGSNYVRLAAPVVYQPATVPNSGTRQAVSGSYTLYGTSEIGFNIGSYDTTRPLVIDPVLVYSTYLGGSGDDYAHSVTVDSAGNAYVTGYVFESSFPTTTGAYQTTLPGGGNPVFVTKIKPDGKTLAYSTFIGGDNEEIGTAITVDSAGNAYVTGSTNSNNFPTTANSYKPTRPGSADNWNAFVVKLNPTGSSLLYSTYLGGSAKDEAYGITLDGSQNVYVAGTTWSSNFPTTTGVIRPTKSGTNDAFVAKLNLSITGTAALQYSTYLGGSGEELGEGIVVDSSGNAAITGYSTSSNFPTTTNAYQPTPSGGVGDRVYVSKLNSGGTGLLYSTYLWGDNAEYGENIAIDAQNNLYVTGRTFSTNFPTTTGAYRRTLSGSQDIFAVKLNPTLTGTASLVYGTYLGGSGGSTVEEVGWNVAVDTGGNAYLTGVTGSSTFPTTTGALQPSYGGGDGDAFLIKLNAAGTALLYSTYLGGNAYDFGKGVAVDSLGNAYLAGYTTSPNFPTTTGAFQTVYAQGERDAFVTRINFSSLEFTTSPSTSQINSPLTSSPVVTVKKEDGTTNTSFSGPIGVSLIVSGSSSAVLTGTTTVNAVSGVATFTNLLVDQPGTGYRLLASGLPGSAQSNAFEVISGVVTTTPQIVGVAGGSQIAEVGATFATNFKITIMTIGGQPLSGIAVTFTVPVTGATGTFAGGSQNGSIYNTTTDANGLATSSIFTANGITGTYQIKIQSANVITPLYYAASNLPANITLNDLRDHTFVAGSITYWDPVAERPVTKGRVTVLAENPDGGGPIWVRNTPENIFDGTVTQLMRDNKRVFALTTAGSVWATSDGVNWDKVYDPANSALSRNITCHRQSRGNAEPYMPKITQLATDGSQVYASVTGMNLCEEEFNNLVSTDIKPNGIYKYDTTSATLSRYRTFYRGTYPKMWCLIYLYPAWLYALRNFTGVSYATTGNLALGGTDTCIGDEIDSMITTSLNEFSSYADINGGVLQNMYPTVNTKNYYYRLAKLYEVIASNPPGSKEILSGMEGRNENFARVAKFSDNNALFVADGIYLKKSTDDGATWQTLNVVVPNQSGTNTTVTNIYVAVADDKSNTLWIAANNGSIIAASKDRGATWIDQTANLPELGWGGYNTYSILPAQPIPPLGCYEGCPSISPDGVPGKYRVNVASGNLIDPASDLSVRLPDEMSGLRLDFTRYYNSQDAEVVGPLGHGWRHSYQWELVQDTGLNRVTIINPNGRQDVFKRQTDGSYRTPLFSDATLVKDTVNANTFTLTQLDKTVYTFVNGKLTRVRDRNGNGIDITDTKYETAIPNLQKQIRACLSPCTSGSYINSLVVIYKHPFSGLIERVSVTGSSSDTGSAYLTQVRYDYKDSGGVETSRLYSFIDPRGKLTKFDYDTSDRLKSVVEKNDNSNNPDPGNPLLLGTADRRVILVDYDNAGRVWRVKNAKDEQFLFDYSIYGRTSFTDSTGGVTVYHYDTEYRLTKVDEPTGQNRQYQFNGTRSHTTSVQSPNGNATQTEYNAAGLPTKVIQTVRVDGQLKTYTSGVKYHDQSNLPEIITDARGYETKVTFTDSTGKLPYTITDPLGNIITYTYGTGSRVTKTESSNGLITEMFYDARGYLQNTTVSFKTLLTTANPLTTPQATSISTQYNYDALGRLIFQSDSYYGATTPNPLRGTSHTYDRGGLLRTTVNQLGQTATNLYDVFGNLKESTNFLGQKTSYSHDTLNRVLNTTQHMTGELNLVSSVVYDNKGNLQSSTDASGATTTYEYDDMRRLIATTTVLQAGGSQKTINGYDANGNLTIVTSLNNVPGAGGDQITKYDYDELNRLVTTTLAAGVADYKQVNIYDEAGNVIQTRRNNALGNTVAPGEWTGYSDKVARTTTTYDPLNRPEIQTINVSEFPDDDIELARYYYNDKQNWVTMVNGYGISTKTESDALGRTIKTTVEPRNYYQGTHQLQVSYAFYNAQNLPVLTLDPLGNRQEMTYDNLFRSTSTTVYAQQNNSASALTSFTFYTDTSRPQVTTIGPAPHFSRQDMFMDEAGRRLKQTAYVGLGNLNLNIIPTGALNTEYKYDEVGRTTIITDAKGFATKYSYEKTGWLKTVVQTATVGTNVETYTTGYDYDLLGNKLKMTNAKGKVYIYTYNVLNLQATEQNPLGQIWKTWYDGFGRVVRTEDAKLQNTRYTYNHLNHLRAIKTDNPSPYTGCCSIQTSINYNILGQPTSIYDDDSVNGARTTSYNYDDFARPAEVSSIDGIVQYDYDKLNRRTQMRFGSIPSTLKTVGYGYDGISRPITTSNWATPGANTVNYSYSGVQLGTVNYPNGVAANYQFDGANRLTNLEQLKSPSVIYQAAYTLDKVGNRTGIAETVNGVNRTASYSYDELARLTQEVQTDNGTSLTNNYLYDKVGNRQQKVAVQSTETTNYTYDDADRLLSDVTTSGANTRTNNYQYDLNGSLVTETNTISGFPNPNYRYYRYDTRNRLTDWRAVPGGNPLGDPQDVLSATFTYNGMNVRQKMTTANPYADPVQTFTRTYLQDEFAGYPVVLQENNSATGQTSYYQYALGSTSPLFQTNTGANNNLLWYHSDGLGSVRALTNGSGSVVNSQNYGAFGELRDQTGGSTVTNNHLFTGEQQDPTGLYYLRARYYHPSIGRFTSRDRYKGEISSPASLNRYGYAQNNPLRYSDPSGYYACDTLRPAYVSFCQDVAKELNSSPLFTNRTRKKGILTGNSVDTLIALFNDDQVSDCLPTLDRTLPGGSYGRADFYRQRHSYHLTQAQERLEFVLWYSVDSIYNNWEWGSKGLAAEFDDDKYQADPSANTQVRHFLRAVEEGYRGGHAFHLGCAIGHELEPGLFYTKGCFLGRFIYIDNIVAALRYDEQGNYRERDRIIEMLMPDPKFSESRRPRPGVDERGQPVLLNADLGGQSREDFRLTLRGWRLGVAIRNKQITKLPEVQQWLRQYIKG